MKTKLIIEETRNDIDLLCMFVMALESELGDSRITRVASNLAIRLQDDYDNLIGRVNQNEND